MLGYTDQALQTFATALAIQVRIEDAQGRGRSLRGIGETYYALGELETATEYLEQALVLAAETNDGRVQQAIHRTLGNIAALEGNHTAALERHQTALRFATSATDRAYLELLIARDLINLGRTAEAATHAGVANETAATAGSDRLTAAALLELGRVEARQGPASAGAAATKLERAHAGLGLDAAHALQPQHVARDGGAHPDGAPRRSSPREAAGVAAKVADPLGRFGSRHPRPTSSRELGRAPPRARPSAQQARGRCHPRDARTCGRSSLARERAGSRSRRRADRRGALTALPRRPPSRLGQCSTTALPYALGTPASYVFVVTRERIAAVTCRSSDHRGRGARGFADSPHWHRTAGARGVTGNSAAVRGTSINRGCCWRSTGRSNTCRSRRCRIRLPRTAPHA
jgi:tetratricopeptide (TPR) repeat protein